MLQALLIYIYTNIHHRCTHMTGLLHWAWGRQDSNTVIAGDKAVSPEGEAGRERLEVKK